MSLFVIPLKDLEGLAKETEEWYQSEECKKFERDVKAWMNSPKGKRALRKKLKETGEKKE
jgi:hypothetical protein